METVGSYGTATAAVEYAGWGRRAVAFILDYLIVSVAAGITEGILLAIGLPNALVAIVTAVAAVAYYVVSNGGEGGQTVGKMALGIAVRDATAGGPIGYGRALGRYLITILFAILLVIPVILDYLWPLWDDRHQTWHDKVVKSVVIRRT